MKAFAKGASSTFLVSFNEPINKPTTNERPEVAAVNQSVRENPLIKREMRSSESHSKIMVNPARDAKIQPRHPYYTGMTPNCNLFLPIMRDNDYAGRVISVGVAIKIPEDGFDVEFCSF